MVFDLVLCVLRLLGAILIFSKLGIGSPLQEAGLMRHVSSCCRLHCKSKHSKQFFLGAPFRKPHKQQFVHDGFKMCVCMHEHGFNNQQSKGKKVCVRNISKMKSILFLKFSKQTSVLV